MSINRGSKRHSILLNSGLASNNETNNGEFSFMASQASYSKMTSKQRKKVSSSKTSSRSSVDKPIFINTAIHIDDYKNLIKGNEYYIGYGDKGDHGYYFTGIFDGLKDGNAVFRNYSQLNKDGKKYKDVKYETILSLDRQPRLKKYIYQLTQRSNLPNELIRHIKTFTGGPNHSYKRTKKNKNKNNKF
jgi:hypothetical protein